MPEAASSLTLMRKSGWRDWHALIDTVFWTNRHPRGGPSSPGFWPETEHRQSRWTGPRICRERTYPIRTPNAEADVRPMIESLLLC